jgi:hypothetical protein
MKIDYTDSLETALSRLRIEDVFAVIGYALAGCVLAGVVL